MQACPTEQSCSLVTESESSAVTLVRFDVQKRGKRQAGAVTVTLPLGLSRSDVTFCT